MVYAEFGGKTECIMGNWKIENSRLTLSDFYTLSQTILRENHTLHSGTYLYSPYMEVATPVVRALSIVKLGQSERLDALRIIYTCKFI